MKQRGKIGDMPQFKALSRQEEYEVQGGLSTNKNPIVAFIDLAKKFLGL